MEVDEGSDQKSDSEPHWMAEHARLKNEFTEDTKCKNLMSWLILSKSSGQFHYLTVDLGFVQFNEIWRLAISS